MLEGVIQALNWCFVELLCVVVFHCGCFHMLIRDNQTTVDTVGIQQRPHGCSYEIIEGQWGLLDSLGFVKCHLKIALSLAEHLTNLGKMEEGVMEDCPQLGTVWELVEPPSGTCHHRNTWGDMMLAEPISSQTNIYQRRQYVWINCKRDPYILMSINLNPYIYFFLWLLFCYYYYFLVISLSLTK